MTTHCHGHGAQLRHALLSACDTLNDFASFSMVVTMPFTLFFNNQIPTIGVLKFISLAKTQPSKRTFSGAESSSRLSAALWLTAAR